jgi:dsRNA-specific ribonuclease
VPRYRLLAGTGPDHDKTFQVELRLKGLVTLGTGKSKKAAEQDAARQALAQLAEDNRP